MGHAVVQADVTVLLVFQIVVDAVVVVAFVVQLIAVVDCMPNYLMHAY